MSSSPKQAAGRNVSMFLQSRKAKLLAEQKQKSKTSPSPSPSPTTDRQSRKERLRAKKNQYRQKTSPKFRPKSPGLEMTDEEFARIDAEINQKYFGSDTRPQPAVKKQNTTAFRRKSQVNRYGAPVKTTTKTTKVESPKIKVENRAPKPTTPKPTETTQMLKDAPADVVEKKHTPSEDTSKNGSSEPAQIQESAESAPEPTRKATNLLASQEEKSTALHSPIVKRAEDDDDDPLFDDMDFMVQAIVAYAYGSNKVEAGVVFRLTIITKDFYGEQVYKEEAVICGVLKGKEEDLEDIPVKSNGDGSYVVTLNIERTGRYEFFVLEDGQSISDTPFQLYVSPSKATAATCRLDGELAYGGMVGEQMTGELILKDKFYNRVTKGKYDVQATIPGHEVAVSREENGNFLLTTTPKTAGEFEVVVTLDGEHVEGSPFEVQFMVDEDF